MVRMRASMSPGSERLTGSRVPLTASVTEGKKKRVRESVRMNPYFCWYFSWVYYFLADLIQTRICAVKYSDLNNKALPKRNRSRQSAAYCMLRGTEKGST